MDKLQHYIVATWIALVWLPIWNRAIWFDSLGDWSLWVGYITFLIGITLFEVYQELFKKGQFDWWDIVAGAMGGGVVLISILSTF